MGRGEIEGEGEEMTEGRWQWRDGNGMYSSGRWYGSGKWDGSGTWTVGRQWQVGRQWDRAAMGGVSASV